MQGFRKWLLSMVAGAAMVAPASAQLYNNGSSAGDNIVLPKPEEVQKLTAYPAKVTLKGLDDSTQMIVSGQLKDLQQDFTGDVQYIVANPAIAKVTPSGRIVPLANGSTEITAKYGNHVAKMNVQTESCDVDLPINFGNHIVPIFTKLGCNGGGCHGKSGGQNGFALSLLGFVPEVDYQTLVKENRGRRLFPAAPDSSLLLTKATGISAHAGGKRMEVDSDEYKLIRRWIGSGTPFGSEKDPTVTKISVYPEVQIMARNNRQQIQVIAHYSDGSQQDVTQRAQYESNDQEVAVVDGSALVRTLTLPGQAAIMARYQGTVAVFRTVVPLSEKTPDYKFEGKTVVDQFTQKKWKELNIVPSDLCTDPQFIRRVSLDLTGSLPTPEQVAAFVDSKDPAKRDKLIDNLLATQEYSYLFANKWADILRVKRRNQPDRAQGTFAFHGWIRNAIANDMPYDKFVRSIVAASGDETQTPPTVWYKELTNVENFVDDLSQVFLGQRIACAQCHHHPYEKWSQDDYWGLAAFFGRVGRKQMQIPGGAGGQQAQRQIIFNKGNGTVLNKRNNQPAKIQPLDGEPMEISAEEDPRQHLANWMSDPKNPFFARAVANRYWSHFFGRGIVDPIDDMRVTNPPSNPELLDALAKELVDSKFSLKHLIKVIVKSRTYQLSSLPNDFNKHDKQAYARFYPRRMSAEVLYDAINQVTNVPATFGGLPTDKNAPNRAIMLPDEAFPSYFLDVFGRPQRLSACECERVNEANLAQALHLLNSQEIQDKLTRGNSRADLLAKDTRPDDVKVKEMFVWAFARQPSQQHLDLALEHIQKSMTNKKAAYENLLWALINTKEFIFNQ